METKECIKCGVVLCDKNWRITRGKYLNSKCAHCIRKTDICLYTYNTLKEERVSKRNANKIYNKLFKLRHPERIKATNNKIRTRDSKTLHDNYVKTLLTGHSELSFKDITPEMVEIKRKQLKLKRNVKKEKNKRYSC